MPRFWRQRIMVFGPARAGPRGRKPTMKKILGWTVAAVVSLGGVAACGSDSKSSSTTKATTAENTNGSTETGTGSGNAAVDAFCKQADDLAVKLKAVLADPASADAAAVTASAAKLTTDAAALAGSNPSDVDKINACTKKLTDAATGG